MSKEKNNVSDVKSVTVAVIVLVAIISGVSYLKNTEFTFENKTNIAINHIPKKKCGCIE